MTIINNLHQASRPAATVKSPSFPILGILGIFFIVLKLTGNVAWSWWWVLAPFWVPYAIILGIFVVILLIAVVVGVIKGLRK